MKLYRHELDYPFYEDYGVILEPTKVRLREFRVIKTTPCGYWIVDEFNKKRWVSNSSRKRFAYPTIEESLNYFIKRKNFFIGCLNYRIRINREVVEMAKNMLEDV